MCMEFGVCLLTFQFNFFRQSSTRLVESSQMTDKETNRLSGFLKVGHDFQRIKSRLGVDVVQ